MIAILLSIANVLCAQQEEELSLRLMPAHSEIRVDDPLYFKARLENTGKSTIVFRRPVCAMMATLGVHFRKVGDQEFQALMPVGSAGRDIIAASQHLKPSHVFASHEVLLADELTGWCVSPGEYELRVNVTSQTRTYYSVPVTIRVLPIDPDEHANIQHVRRYLPAVISASSLSTEAPPPKLVALEPMLSPGVLKDTLTWSRKWSEIMRNDALDEGQRAAALEELSKSLDDVTGEAFITITANRYLTARHLVAALRELAKLPEPTHQADSIRGVVLYELERRLSREKTNN